LTREGWYYLAMLMFIIGGAVLRSVNLLVILAGAMIGPLLFNWRLVIASLTGLVVRRKLPPQITAGELLTVEIAVENSRKWMSSWLLTVEDWIDLDRQFARNSSLRAEARLVHVPAGGHALGTYKLTLHRRGRYRFGPLRVSTRFPLGLVLGQITLPDRGELIVAPRLGRLLPAWLSLIEATQTGDQRRHPERGSLEGDYYGLRPWQSGDSLRWVHWRTTAKLNQPVVRQFERRRNRDVAIVLDPYGPNQSSQREEGLAELAISLAATALVDLSSRGHSRLTLGIADRETRCYSGPSSGLFCEELLGELAELPLSRGASLQAAISRAIEAAPHGARIVVISPRAPDHPLLAQSQAELPIDPDDVAWIDTSSDQLESLFSLQP